MANKNKHKAWYRGLPDTDFELKPSVGRKHQYAGRQLTFGKNTEKFLLHRFRRRAYPHVGRVIPAGEAIFLARHHGLPTRLLDWTANPLFALYFACVGDRKEDQEKDGKVWMMVRSEGTEDDDLNAFQLARCEEEEGLFASDEDSIRIIYPFYNSPRLLAQDGAFTLHSHPQKSIESYEHTLFNKGKLDIASLYYWHVSVNKKSCIVRELSSLGITQRLLFPDLDGVARSVWETEVLWNGNPDTK